MTSNASELDRLFQRLLSRFLACHEIMDLYNSAMFIIFFKKKEKKKLFAF